MELQSAPSAVDSRIPEASPTVGPAPVGLPAGVSVSRSPLAFWKQPDLQPGPRGRPCQGALGLVALLHHLGCN